MMATSSARPDGEVDATQGVHLHLALVVALGDAREFDERTRSGKED